MEYAIIDGTNVAVYQKATGAKACTEPVEVGDSKLSYRVLERRIDHQNHGTGRRTR
jgi:hypothetical protein